MALPIYDQLRTAGPNVDPTKDYYAILGASLKSSKDEIKQLHKRLRNLICPYGEHT
jgi:hypothetical protein